MSKTTSGDMYVFLSLLHFWDDRRCGACMFLRVEVTALCLNVCGCECVCIGVCVCVCLCSARICVRQTVFSCAKGHDKDTKAEKKRVSDRIKEFLRTTHT